MTNLQTILMFGSLGLNVILVALLKMKEDRRMR